MTDCLPAGRARLFEYKIVGSYAKQLEDTINELAKNGWRFVTFVEKEENEDGPTYYLFLMEADAQAENVEQTA